MVMLTYDAAPADSSSPTCQAALGNIQLPLFGLLDRHTQYQCHLIGFLQILVTVAVSPLFPANCFPVFCPIEKKDVTTVWFCVGGAGDGTPGLRMLGSAQLRLLPIRWVVAGLDASSC